VADAARNEDVRALAEANAKLDAAIEDAQAFAEKITQLETELKTEREIRHAEQDAHAQSLAEIQTQTQARIAQLQEQMRGMEVHMLKQIDEARDRAKEEKARADHIERTAKADAEIMDARYRRDIEAISKNLDAERKSRETMLLDLGRAKGELEITRNEMLEARKKLEGLPDVDMLVQERDGLRERLDAAMLREVLRGREIPADGWIPLTDLEAEDAAEYLVNRGLVEFDDAQESIRMLNKPD
jgi:chromosome segregation ATPase